MPPSRSTLTVVALALVACHPGGRPARGDRRADAVSERSAGFDAGPPTPFEELDASPEPEAAAAAAADPRPPRIPIPSLDAEPTVKVSIHRGKGPLVVRGKQLKVDGNPVKRGRIDLGWDAGSLTLGGKARSGRVELTAVGNLWVRGIGRFPGSLLVSANASHLHVVNEVPLERYLQTVVQSEVPATWPTEALEAQAVAARSYALARMALQHGDSSLEATVMDQVYRPRRLDERVVAAVKATRGQVLVSGRELIETKYHSTCGGRTENPDEVWPELGMGHDWSVICWTCRASPHYRWSLSLTFAEVKARLAAVRDGLGRVRGVEVASKSPAGRVRAVKISTGEGAIELSGREFRRAISLRKLRSSFFDIRPAPGGIKILGKGFGHGVGMCQWGAAGMAKAGKSFQEILAYYYRGTKLHRLYE